VHGAIPLRPKSSARRDLGARWSSGRRARAGGSAVEDRPLLHLRAQRVPREGSRNCGLRWIHPPPASAPSRGCEDVVHAEFRRVSEGHQDTKKQASGPRADPRPHRPFRAADGTSIGPLIEGANQGSWSTLPPTATPRMGRIDSSFQPDSRAHAEALHGRAARPQSKLVAADLRPLQLPSGPALRFFAAAFGSSAIAFRTSAADRGTMRAARGSVRRA